ncbi:hypothetical protein EEJ42_15580 [Streptomyces botrytidirepellens]|uniref:Uncharacterized protein n=1 Tax=Streptomyces botrytidirepellens TaxID=2486417 RepID=A0A3M8WE63_9ACTN|nr:hypothetical protein EEJ42_15580 [Streptomyces botrytidirepellens]
MPPPRISAPPETFGEYDDGLEPWGPDPVPPDYSFGGAAVDLEFATGTLSAVRMGFGELFAQERRRTIREGWGYTVELPAVLELLDGIHHGRTNARDAQSVLLKAAHLLYNPLRCFEAEDPDELRTVCRQNGGCALCEERRSWFDALLDDSDARWNRLQEPESYPFTAGRNGLHETTCSVVKREIPSSYARPTGDAYTSALHAFSHTVDPHSSQDDFEGSGDYPRFEAMTSQQARKWITDRTGPKGGRHYKLCHLCAPAP